MLDEVTAEQFARVALSHVTREYPNKPEHVWAGPGDGRTPRAMHPVFYGSFDWHSCVHSHWLLARVLRRYPDGAAAGAIRAHFDGALVPDKVAGECAYLAAPTARGFKRPYGWGWLLKLAAELALLPDPRWAAAVDPLARVFAQRWTDFLPLATYPVRVGTHFNTAFGLRMAADWAEPHDPALFALLQATAVRWYGEDRDCPAWGEPSGDDFLSAALIEAECMRRLLPADRFAAWMQVFLPRLEAGHPMVLFTPAEVTDRTDGKLAHLDGLNLSRAWCFGALAGKSPVVQEAADAHLTAGLPHIVGDYMGEHWLASFAALALDGG